MTTTRVVVWTAQAAFLSAFSALLAWVGICALFGG